MMIRIVYSNDGVKWSRHKCSHIPHFISSVRGLLIISIIECDERSLCEIEHHIIDPSTDLTLKTSWKGEVWISVR